MGYAKSVIGTFVILVALGLPRGGAAAQSAWQVESIAPASTLRAPPALAFDALDRPQVVYGVGTSSYLQYTYGSSGAAVPVWTAPVTTPISGIGNASDGQAYLLPVGNSVYLGYRYGCGAGPSGPYAAASVFDGSTWTNYRFPSSSSYSFGGPYGLVADTGGNPQWIAAAHLSFGGPVGMYLYSKSGTTDVFTPISSAIPAVPYYSGMPLQQGGQAVLDSSGNLHTVQFTDTAGGQLLYAKGPVAGPFAVTDNLDAGWQEKAGRPSIAVDSAGNAHIAYTQLWPYYGVKCLNWNGSSWDTEWIEQGGNAGSYMGTYPQALVDKEGMLHVIYADLLNGLLKHAVKQAGAWQIESIDTIGTQATYGMSTGALAAAIDSRGGIGVAYWNPKDAAMKYAYLVPEPASLALLGIAVAAAVRRKRKLQEG